MKSASRKEKRMMGGLRNFFFAEQSPYGLALVRMFLTAAALIPMIRRFPRVRELFSSDGAPQQLIELFGQGAILPELPASFASALYGIARASTAVTALTEVTGPLNWKITVCAEPMARGSTVTVFANGNASTGTSNGPDAP